MSYITGDHREVSNSLVNIVANVQDNNAVIPCAIARYNNYFDMFTSVNIFKKENDMIGIYKPKRGSKKAELIIDEDLTGEKQELLIGYFLYFHVYNIEPQKKTVYYRDHRSINLNAYNFSNTLLESCRDYYNS